MIKVIFKRTPVLIDLSFYVSIDCSSAVRILSGVVLSFSCLVVALRLTFFAYHALLLLLLLLLLLE